MVMASAVGLLACEGGGGEGAKPAASGAAVAEADVAVPADFADEADSTITAANYKSELDTLDKEIGSE